MYCKKCGGRIFVDRTHTVRTRLELYCTVCSKRWMIKVEGNAFAEWLMEKERLLAKSIGISI